MREFKHKKELLAGIILVLGIFALYYTFSPVNCSDFACFQAHAMKCKPANYVNDQVEASWNYKIIGKSENSCDVEVKLLIAKESNIDMRKYEGAKMICSYNPDVSGYPEENLDSCTGKLKEGLQSIVIDRLYRYIVTNIGEIRQEITA